MFITLKFGIRYFSKYLIPLKLLKSCAGVVFAIEKRGQYNRAQTRIGTRESQRDKRMLSPLHQIGRRGVMD